MNKILSYATLSGVALLLLMAFSIASPTQSSAQARCKAVGGVLVQAELLCVDKSVIKKY